MLQMPYSMADVEKASSQHRFTVVSTFAGGGGSSTGYRIAGGKILFANEFIPTAAATYRLNYPTTPVEEIDLRKVTRKGGRKYVLDWFAGHGIDEGKYDILDGSPPCSAFSTAGKGEIKIEAIDQRYSDAVQSRIGMLIHDFVYVANCTKPKICILENVPNIVKSHVFQDALNRLRKWGYLVNFNVLTASAFGVPQRRKRLFAVALRPDVAVSAGLKTEADLLTLYPVGNKDEPTVRQALEGVTIQEDERQALLRSMRRSSTYELLKSLPKNPDTTMRIANIRPDWKSDFNLARAGWNAPCPTLTQMGQQMGRGGICHPSEDRVFAIAELKRLMALPDDFRLTGTFNQKAERIGRMVPPLMTAALADKVTRIVLGK
jgi:DNA-cytosine methyltransferase